MQGQIPALCSGHDRQKTMWRRGVIPKRHILHYVLSVLNITR